MSRDFAQRRLSGTVDGGHACSDRRRRIFRSPWRIGVLETPSAPLARIAQHEWSERIGIGLHRGSVVGVAVRVYWDLERWTERDLIAAGSGPMRINR